MKILVDSDLNAKGILPSPIGSLRAIEVNSSALADSVQKAVGEVAAALADIEKFTPGFKVGEIAFTLTVTGSGEVSLVSLFKAGGSVQSGIQIKLQPRS
jgi:hypothetical protein